MRVEDFSLQMGVQKSAQSLRLTKESFRFLRPNDTERRDFNLIPVRVETKPVEIEADSEVELRELILKKLIEMLTGKKIKLLSVEDLTPQDAHQISEPQLGVEYSKTQLEAKIERLSFYAQGEIRTQDGRRVSFSLELELENIEIEISSQKVRAGSLALIDPLIINLDGSPELLSDSSFSFDLNGDGKDEELPLLAEGKGFIFFDRDGNGRVSDGREILGVKSSDAFKELKELDTDGNGWIDEADSAYDRLKVWLKTPTKDDIKSLRELGIGALYTGSAYGNFGLEDKGIVRNLGIYLRENLEVGSLIKLDFYA